MEANATPPGWYRVGSWMLFAWMVLGVLSFLNSEMMTAEALAELPAEMQTLVAATPLWMRITYGVATISGLAGALGLVLRKSWSIGVLGLSLVAVLIQMGYWLFGMGALATLGAGAAGMPLVVIILGAFAVYFAVTAKQRGIIAS